jgi:hypothetical protein
VTRVVAFGPPSKNISRLSEFDAQDTQATVLYLTWQAREWLGDAERKEDQTLTVRSGWCEQSAALLLTAVTLFDRTVPSISQASAYARTRDLLCRAHATSVAAVENGKVATSYAGAISRPSPTSWEWQHASKTISIFKRAAEAGRQETHRALVELCELFPDAMPTEE